MPEGQWDSNHLTEKNVVLWRHSLNRAERTVAETPNVCNFQINSHPDSGAEMIDMRRSLALESDKNQIGKSNISKDLNLTGEFRVR
jgi:hypothetical protein